MMEIEMGDRANCVVHQNSFGDHPPVYLYTHWGGYELLKTVQRAIQKKWRWDDEAYLTRIIFDEMTNGYHGGETGFGITTSPPDNEHKYVVVNPSKSVVYLQDPATEEAGETWSFEDFCKADLSEIEY